MNKLQLWKVIATTNWSSYNWQQIIKITFLVSLNLSSKLYLLIYFTVTLIISDVVLFTLHFITGISWNYKTYLKSIQIDQISLCYIWIFLYDLTKNRWIIFWQKHRLTPCTNNWFFLWELHMRWERLCVDKSAIMSLKDRFWERFTDD